NAEMKTRQHACSPGSSGDDRWRTAWIPHAAHPDSHKSASTGNLSRMNYALTLATGVLTAHTRSTTDPRLRAQSRSAIPTAKAGGMDAEVVLNGGGDSVPLALPESPDSAQTHPAEALDLPA